MTDWIIVLGMGIITYVIRLSLIALFKDANLTPIVRQALQYVPPAVLSAIIFPELFQPGGQLDLSLGNARLVAGMTAGLAAWQTKNVLITIMAGMFVLWLLQSLG